MFRDTSKSICGNCHTRGHDKKRCSAETCESAVICGEIDKHPSEKKELSELAKKKQAVEIELKTLKTELEVKNKVKSEVQNSFESKIHDELINSNPGKYLTEQGKPKEGIIKADTYILKRYYQGNFPQDLRMESQIWKTVISSYEEKMNINPPKNCVQRELERRGGIRWPNKHGQSETKADNNPIGSEHQQFQQSFPLNYWAYGQNYTYAYPAGYMGYQAGMVRHFTPQSSTLSSPVQQGLVMMNPVASPPPPPDDTELPPLPDELKEN